MAFWFAVFVAAACESQPPPDAGKVRVGMTKPELEATLGAPLEKGKPTAGASGRSEETWLYRLKPEVASAQDVTKGVLTSGVGFFDGPNADHRYHFVFVDERLARWGPEKK
ncbi:MAG TPA: hypothetical protein VF384_16685 [Planctomycetota bacterium]